MSSITATKMPLNKHVVQNIMKMGEAMMFGKEAGTQPESFTGLLPTISTKRDSAQIIEWLAKDYQNNSALLGLLVAEMAAGVSITLHCGYNSACTNYTLDTNAINRYAQKAFNDDMSNLAASMFSGSLVSVSDSTLRLAEQVADMKEDDTDIESWAKKLADDIGKGRD